MESSIRAAALNTTYAEACELKRLFRQQMASFSVVNVLFLDLLVAGQRSVKLS